MRDKHHPGSIRDGGASGAGDVSVTTKKNLSSLITSTDVKISVIKHKKFTTSKVRGREMSGKEDSPKNSSIHKAALTHQTTCSSNTTCSGSRGDAHKESHRLDRPDLAIFRARLLCQPTLPTINTATVRNGRPTGATHSVPTHTKLAEDSYSSCDNKQVKKLRRLLATHPTLLSQSTHARKLMERLYTAPPASSRVRGPAEIGTVQGDFTWTEVFPVLKETSGGTVRTREKPTRPVTGNGEVLLPKLTTAKERWGTRGTQGAYADTCMPSTAKAPEKINFTGTTDEFHLKLPQIMH